jgi:hypothetical protein
MALFGRKKPAGMETLVATTGNPLPDDQVPGRLEVAAVSPPGRPVGPGEQALVSGLLLGPFPVQLVQLTITADRTTWPAPDAMLPTVVDPTNPLNFVVVWDDVVDDGTVPPVVQPQQGQLGWDVGVDGGHARAVAEWLAARGFAAGDFGPTLELVAPGLTALLDTAGARYASVIRGTTALALMSSGIQARAVVSGVQPLDIPAQMLPGPGASMAWLTLSVTPPAGAPYTVTIRFGFRSPERFAAIATVGTELPVRIDPTDPKTVTIDLPALGITPG